MAKLVGEYKLTGRFDDVRFYEMGGEIIVAMVSSLDAKTVKTHARFARTRIEYKRLAKASPIAKRVYRQLPKEIRLKGYFQAMTGIASNMLKQGITEQQTHDMLYQAATSKPCLDSRTVPEQAYHIAAAIYKQLPQHQHLIGYFEAIMDQAIQLLQKNYTAEQVHHLLCQATMPKQQAQQKRNTAKAKNTNTQSIIFVEELLEQIFTSAVHDQPILQRRIVNDMPP